MIFLEALPLLLSDFLLIESGRAPVHVLQHLISLLHRVVHILATTVAGLWHGTLVAVLVELRRGCLLVDGTRAWHILS